MSVNIPFKIKTIKNVLRVYKSRWKNREEEKRFRTSVVNVIAKRSRLVDFDLFYHEKATETLAARSLEDPGGERSVLSFLQPRLKNFLTFSFKQRKFKSWVDAPKSSEIFKE